ncbi:MAG: hypothetical protein EPO21_01010 [Chloroflexota bacterium]|nr:MAG: hypothetical protein EPO21_01010 [Chloroflexota bacterium]
MKHRKITLLVGLAAVLVAVVVMTGPAFALPNYTTATGQACGICHVNPAGGGPLTPRGTAFAAVPTHITDPAGAFTSSGAAASPSPSPAASPSPAVSPSPSPAASPSPSPAVSPSPSPAVSPSPSPVASPSALPRTGGIPILPFGLIGGFGLFALGWIVRRFGR